MNKLDWIIITILLISSVIGLVRGIIKEILKLITFIAAILSAIYLKSYFSFIFNFIKVTEIREIISGVLIFIIVFIVGNIITFLITQMLSTQGFGKFMNQLLGTIYGFARAAGIIIVIVALLEKNLTITNKNWWINSKTLVQIQKVSKVVYDWIPLEWKNKLEQLSQSSNN